MADDVVVIDEIGKMELFSEEFAAMVERIIEDPKIRLLATILLKDFHPLIKKAKSSSDAILLYITEDNRDDVPPKAAKLLEDAK